MPGNAWRCRRAVETLGRGNLSPEGLELWKTWPPGKLGGRGFWPPVITCGRGNFTRSFESWEIFVLGQVFALDRVFCNQGNLLANLY